MITVTVDLSPKFADLWERTLVLAESNQQNLINALGQSLRSSSDSLAAAVSAAQTSTNQPAQE